MTIKCTFILKFLITVGNRAWSECLIYLPNITPPHFLLKIGDKYENIVGDPQYGAPQV